MNLGFSKRTLSFIILALVLTACGQVAQPTADVPWEPQDLRTLELPNQPDPALDLVAAYARQTASDLELRFDLLDTPDAYQTDLYLYIDTGPDIDDGYIKESVVRHQPSLAWDLLLIFPARAKPAALLADGSPAAIRPRLIRDSLQDTLTIRISLSQLKALSQTQPDDLAYQMFVSLPGQARPGDAIGPLMVSSKPPSVQAGLALAFWDTLPADTPAQALRRWDGAHTGPFGQRHGLSILLRESARNGIPIILLDLKHPTRLAALQALGGSTALLQQAAAGQVILADWAYGAPSAAAQGLSLSQQAGQQFQVKQPKSVGALYYGPLSGSLPAGYPMAFANLAQGDHIQNWDGVRLIPLPANGGDLISQEGLSTEARTALLRAALSSDPADMLVLGGSLPRSPWGDLLNAAPAFEYIRGHPWIWPLDSKGLLEYPAVPGEPNCADLLCLDESIDYGPIGQPLVRDIQAAIEAAPQNFFTDLAWQAYLDLTQPDTDQNRQALRAGYLGQIGPLLAAARWYQEPVAASACALDLDWDGMPECLLSSTDSFLVIDPQGARLVLAVAKTPDGPAQIIGQRSQLAVGLGDPLDWHPESGPAGDPQDIPGAFYDPANPWQAYQWQTEINGVTFTNPQSGDQKQYRLVQDSFEFTWQRRDLIRTSIPLILLDAHAYQPGWYASYHLQPGDNSVTFAVNEKQGVQVKVIVSGASLRTASFSGSLARISQSEDPNTNLGEDAFLPFPLALLYVDSPTTFSVTITW